jgi:hypothetical protein
LLVVVGWLVVVVLVLVVLLFRSYFGSIYCLAGCLRFLLFAVHWHHADQSQEQQWQLTCHAAMPPPAAPTGVKKSIDNGRQCP